MENPKTNIDSHQEKQFKLLLIGEQAVGKSSLMNRYVDNVFEINIMGTAGLDLKKKIVEINNEKIKIYIFDTAGQERFRTIAKNQYKKADAIIIIYDVTDRKSFESVNDWIVSIKSDVDPVTERLLIGNKIDLVNERTVAQEEGVKIAEKYGMPFIETSAKESLNVKEAFLKVINTLYYKEVGNNKGKENKRGKNKSGGCCYAAS
jgi:small GTP-binding protein